MSNEIESAGIGPGGVLETAGVPDDSAAPAPKTYRRTRILIVGGGYVGLYTAMRLLKKLGPNEATVTLVDPKSYMTYQPFLPEAAAGSINSRNICVPLRRVLKKAEVITGYVTDVEHKSKYAVIQPLEGEPFQFDYDILVMGAGAVSRTLPVPGLADWGIGFKTVEESIALRNRVIECLDIAESARDPEIRERNLSFVVVGAGYSGVEAIAEMEDMCRYATRYYRNIRPDDLRWVLVEGSDHILPEVGPKLGMYALNEMKGRGIEIRLNTKLDSCTNGVIELSDGSRMLSDTLVWTAGVRPSPVTTYTDLPLDEKGHVKGRTTLQVEGLEHAFTAGDCAAIPDLTQPGKICAPSAQHALRQSKVLAHNIVVQVRGKGKMKDYRHSYAGAVASLGLYKGVANIKGIQVRGLLAWFMHRTYHGWMIPTFGRTVQVVSDWTLQLFFRREVVGLWGVHQPFQEFADAARNLAPTSRSKAIPRAGVITPRAGALAESVEAEAPPQPTELNTKDGGPVKQPAAVTSPAPETAASRGSEPRQADRSKRESPSQDTADIRSGAVKAGDAEAGSDDVGPGSTAPKGDSEARSS